MVLVFNRDLVVRSIDSKEVVNEVLHAENGKKVVVSIMISRCRQGDVIAGAC
jgi:hypothetical protein